MAIISLTAAANISAGLILRLATREITSHATNAYAPAMAAVAIGGRAKYFDLSIGGALTLLRKKVAASPSRYPAEKTVSTSVKIGNAKYLRPYQLE